MRSLPWRQNPSPYRVWLSEVILQQTRVDQGLPYYHKFIENYPTIQDLASASLDDILKQWQGLGYYSRARNMHKCAIAVVDDYKGEFPREHKLLIKLPGIGPYTAAAISSICFEQAVPVVDGNVFRVLSRFFGRDTPIDTSAGRKEFQALAEEFLNFNQPGTHNQAMMELGALICKPKNPECGACPFQFNCIAFEEKSPLAYPKKERKTKQRKRYFNYLVTEGDQYFIKQRNAKDVWQLLHDFPLIESDVTESDWAKLLPRFEREYGLKLSDTAVLIEHKTIKHILSHQIIYATFWRIKSNYIKFDSDCDIFEADLQDIQERYAVPILIKKYLSDLKG